jgi:hypothetical protein
MLSSKRQPILRSPTIMAAILSALVVLGTLAHQARGEADGPDFYRVVAVDAGDVLTIRAEPDARAKRLGSIPPGADCVRNLGCSGGLTLQEFTTLSEAERSARLRQNPRWCRVDYRGTTGWVAGRFLAEGTCTAP